MRLLAMLVFCSFAALAHAAQLYEWVDEKGVKQYTQYPPPPNIKQMREKTVGSNVIQTGGMSYSMQQAVKNFPLTLYIVDCGQVCSDARAYLAKRGAPYTAKDPQKDEERENFKKLTNGGNELPLLVVGTFRTLKGFSASQWDAALNEAGYPSSTPTAPVNPN